jgi:cell division protein FtsZ
MDPVTAQSVVKVVAAALILLVAIRLILLGPPGRRLGPARKQVIKVVGVGGGGGNAVNAMVRSGTRGVEFVAINTDRQALRESVAGRRIQIGSAMTEGLGSGGDPTVGKRAAEDDIELITQALENSDMVFITAGLGGGTGSGAASIVAGIARQQGALTIGVVTKPFAFEGPGRNTIAESAAQAMRANVDALITVRNDRVRNRVPETATVSDAFDAIDEVLRQSVQGILDVIGIAGRVNLDFADVRALLKDGGPTVMGVGRAAGDKRVVMATHRAVSSGLLENTIDGATRIMLNVAGSKDIALSEVTAAAEELRAAADKDVNLTFGASFDPSLDEEVVVTVIATGMTAGRLLAPARKSSAAGKRMVAQRPARAARRIPVTGQARRPRTGRPKLTPPAAAQMAAVTPVAAVARPVKPAVAASTPSKARAERPKRIRPARTGAAPAAPAPRRRATKRVAPVTQPTMSTAATMGEDEYDVPTFMRKPIDRTKSPETPRSAS